MVYPPSTRQLGAESRDRTVPVPFCTLPIAPSKSQWRLSNVLEETVTSMVRVNLSMSS